MTAKSASQLSTEILGNVPSNNPPTLTAASLRQLLQDMIDSLSLAGTPFTLSATSLLLGSSDLATSLAAITQSLQNTYGQRNIIGANGGLEIWQRGAGGSASISVNASSTIYGPDRWYINAGVNQACTITQVAGIVTGSRYAAKVQRNNGQTGTTPIAFGFPLDSDECAIIAGQTVALSFVAKAGGSFSPTGGTLSIALNSGSGSPIKFSAGYFSATTPISVNQAITTIATRFIFVSSVVPVATTQAEVTFTMTCTGTAGADDSFTIDDVQLEVLPTAISTVSVFERWPFERMLSACKRHFWKTFVYGTAPAQNVGVSTGEFLAAAGKTTAGELFPRHPVSMRAIPAVTTFNPAANNTAIRDETSAADTTGTAVTNVTTEGAQIFATGNIAAVGDILGVHVTFDAGI